MRLSNDGYLEPNFARYAAIYKSDFFRDQLIYASVLSINYPGTIESARAHFNDMHRLLESMCGPPDSGRADDGPDRGPEAPAEAKDIIWRFPSKTGDTLWRCEEGEDAQVCRGHRYQSLDPRPVSMMRWLRERSPHPPSASPCFNGSYPSGW